MRHLRAHVAIKQADRLGTSGNLYVHLPFCDELWTRCRGDAWPREVSLA